MLKLVTDLALPIRRAPETSSEASLRQTLSFLFLCLTGLYLFALLLPSNGANFLRDPDVYWHVATGLKIGRTGSLPHVDELSHTFGGHPWIAKEWLGQLLLSGAYAIAGWRGVALLTVSVAALTFGLLFLVLARQMRITVAVGVAAMAWAFSEGHFNARPLIFADPLIIIWVAGLIEAVENGRAPNLLLLPVIALWANLHASFTFGLATAGWFAIEAVFRSLPSTRAKTIRQWALFLPVALACACLTPYGYRPILMTFNVFAGNDALHYVQEWRPAELDGFNLNNLTLFALLGLALSTGTKLPFWRLAPLIALIFLMLAHIRFAALFAIVAPLVLAAPLVKQFPFLGITSQIKSQPWMFERIAQLSRRFFYPTGGAVVLAALAFAALGPPIAPASEITPRAPSMRCIDRD